MGEPAHRLRSPDEGSDRATIETAIARLGAVIERLQTPVPRRARLPESEHVFREHRLLPSLMTVESWLKLSHYDHDRLGSCAWCDPEGKLPCWSHDLARFLAGEFG